MTLLLSVAGIGAADTLRPEDLFRLVNAASPRVAPDGSRIAFLRQWADAATDRWCSNLWIVGADGSGPRALTTGCSWDHAPSFAPDGRRIAFLSNRSGSEQVHTVEIESGELRRLTELPSAPRGLAFSPDGRYLAFFAWVAAPPSWDVELPAPPPGATWAPPARLVERRLYRHDGMGETGNGWMRLFLLPAEGGEPRRLTGDAPAHDTSFENLDNENGGGSPVFTPDGRFVLFSAARRPGWEREPWDTEVYEVASTGGEPRPLTDRRGPDSRPAVSPDGRLVAYVGFDDRHRGYQVTRLYVLERDGGRPRCLTADFDRSVLAPHWSPDSRGVLFLYHDHGSTRLGFAGLDGSRRELAGSVGDGYSAYGAGSFDVGGDGLFAFTRTRADAPAGIAAGHLGEPASVRTVAAFREELLAGRTLGSLERVRLGSRLDGREIQGFILKPPGFDPGRRYPVILDIHGGPFRDFGDRFDFEKQLWAARGYVVVYGNPRGSDGYGEAFADLIHHAYPGGDADDLFSLLDGVLAREWADAGNVFVTGGSGGGLLTLWMITESDRFRAAAALYPVVSWESLALSSDINPRILGLWFPGPPWEHPEHYRARSPLARVARIKTPTLLLLGEEDQRTPPSEAEQLYTALHHLGVDTVLVRLPGEPHFDERRPSHLLARMLYVVGWFDRYRSPAGP